MGRANIIVPRDGPCALGPSCRPFGGAPHGRAIPPPSQLPSPRPPLPPPLSFFLRSTSAFGRQVAPTSKGRVCGLPIWRIVDAASIRATSRTTGLGPRLLSFFVLPLRGVVMCVSVSVSVSVCVGGWAVRVCLMDVYINIFFFMSRAHARFICLRAANTGGKRQL